MGVKKRTLRWLLAIVAMVVVAVYGWYAWRNKQERDLQQRTAEMIECYRAYDDSLSILIESERQRDSTMQATIGRPYSKPWRAGEVADTNELKRCDLYSCFRGYDLTDSLLQTMRGKSWPDNCPVEPSTLRYMHVLHWNCDDLPQMGELIVHKQIARRVAEAFMDLYNRHYCIERMVLVDRYDGDDERSMADNNTSAFNFRYVTGSTTKISKHGLGLAIDINPLYNPYVKRRTDGSLYVAPEAGRPYATNRATQGVARRTENTTTPIIVPYLADEDSIAYMPMGYRGSGVVSLIDTDDPAYIAFTRQGFTWGGAWQSCQDYQHFEYDLQE